MSGKLLNKIDNRFKLLAEQINDGAWKDPYDPDYDRQQAENALHATLGPMTDGPTWDADWTDPSGFTHKKGTPAPIWTKDEVFIAIAGDPSKPPGDPRSPQYSTTTDIGRNISAAPLWRWATEEAKKYSRFNYQDVMDAYSNGAMAIVTMMRAGADESRVNVISWMKRNVLSAMEKGPSAVSWKAKSVMGNVSRHKKSRGLVGLQGVLGETDPDRIREFANQVKGKYRSEKSDDVHNDNPFEQYSSRYYNVTMQYADALESEDDGRIENIKDEIENLVNDVRDDLTAITPGFETGQSEAISDLSRGKQKFEFVIVPEPNADPITHTEKSNTQKNAEEAVKKQFPGAEIKCIGSTSVAKSIGSLDVASDEGGTMAGQVVGSRNRNRLSKVSVQITAPETVTALINFALQNDVSEAIPLDSPVREKIKNYAVSDIDDDIPGFYKGLGKKDPESLIPRGSLTATELRLILRTFGVDNFFGKEIPRDTVDPRGAPGWWEPGEDPEIEPYTDKDGDEKMWNSIWRRNGSKSMITEHGFNGAAVQDELAQETKEFKELGIATTAVIRLGAGRDKGRELTVSNVRLSKQQKSGLVKVAGAAQLIKSEIMDEGIVTLPILESIDDLDKHALLEACDYVITMYNKVMLEDHMRGIYKRANRIYIPICEYRGGTPPEMQKRMEKERLAKMTPEDRESYEKLEKWSRKYSGGPDEMRDEDPALWRQFEKTAAMLKQKYPITQKTMYR
jgi:hypothetical protein